MKKFLFIQTILIQKLINKYNSCFTVGERGLASNFYGLKINKQIYKIVQFVSKNFNNNKKIGVNQWKRFFAF